MTSYYLYVKSQNDPITAKKSRKKQPPVKINTNERIPLNIDSREHRQLSAPRRLEQMFTRIQFFTKEEYAALRFRNTTNNS